MLNVIKLTRILKLRKLNNTQSMIIIPIPSSSDTALLDFLVNLTNTITFLHYSPSRITCGSHSTFYLSYAISVKVIVPNDLISYH